jgi:hypothetical protein
MRVTAAFNGQGWMLERSNRVAPKIEKGSTGSRKFQRQQVLAGPIARPSGESAPVRKAPGIVLVLRSSALLDLRDRRRNLLLRRSLPVSSPRFSLGSPR